MGPGASSPTKDLSLSELAVNTHTFQACGLKPRVVKQEMGDDDDGRQKSKVLDDTCNFNDILHIYA